MNLLDRLLTQIGYTKADNSASSVGLRDDGARWSMPDYSLARMQGQLYERLSWIQIAVGQVARSAATVALNVKERTGNDAKDIDNHPFELLLSHPNPMQSRLELLEATIAHRALTGNAYWWLNRSSPTAPPTELWLIAPYRIRPVPDGHMGVKGYIYETSDGGGVEIPLDAWEICHFKTFNPTNAYVGLSPIEALATVAVGDMKMTEWNTNHFAKNNAKPQGALAFAEVIPDGRWDKMKADVEREYGGTQRRMMMLRGAGKDVNFLPMALSQKDMEFIQGRTFNKEEIFAVFAPGLSSILAVNATEANALAGRRTFMEMAVYPHLTAVSEKISNDLLPVYGESLYCEFDDVRITDRALELDEQKTYAATHTIDEIRAEYYGDKPIGDERGDLLPVQVTATSGAAAPEQPAQPPPTPPDGTPPDTSKDTPSADDAGDEPPVKAELAKWERKALKGWRDGGKTRARVFESESIPHTLKAYVVGGLESAVTLDDVKQVFTLAEQWEGYP